MAVASHADEDRGAGGVAGGDGGLGVEGPEQGLERAGHAGERHAVGGGGVGEAVTGQVGGDDGEALGENGEEVAPGMGGGAGAVDEEQDGAGAGDLDVPAHAAGADEAAVLAVGPAFEAAIDRGFAHGLRMAAEMAADPAKGSGR